MKKLYFLAFLFVGFFLFGQQKPASNNQNRQPHYTDAQLAGFDKAAAWQKALQKSQKPFEQTEYYNSLERMYVQSKMKVNTQVLHSNVSYTASSSANKTIINLGTYSSFCPNADFSSANFSNWVGGTYNNSAGTNWNTFTPAWTTGIVTNGVNTPAQPYSGFGGVAPRQTILTIPPTVNNPPANCIGWDSIAIGYPNHLSDIPFVPPTGGGVTCRLGNANPNYETEELSYVLNVSAANAQFTFAYAVVLYDGGHAAGEQPFFKVTMTDQNGNPIPGCGQYQVDATLVSTDPTFFRASDYQSFNTPPSWQDGYTAPGVTDPNWFYDIYYKKWTTVGVDLTPYVGTNVTITFQTADCIYGGHWGYAYIDASCSPATAVVNMCQNVNTQQVIGPAGYVSYQWYGPNGNTAPIAAPQGTSDTLVVQNGNLGDTYTVTAVSANGCTTSMQAVLQYSQIGILYTNSTPSCPGGFSGTASVTGTGSPTGLYTYNWLNSLGQSVGNTQQITGLAPGTYSVHLASTAASCGSHDTTVTVGIAPPTISSQIQNFCGSAAYLLTPAGSLNIQWYAPGGIAIPAAQGGANDTLLAVGAANGQVYAVTYNNSGCRDSLLITLTQVSGGTLSHSVLAEVCSDNTYGQITHPANGQATISLSTTALPPYNYSIVGPGFSNSYTNSSATSFTFSALAYGSYTVAAFDGTCFYNDVFRIDTIPVPVNIAVSPTTLCNGQSALLTFTFNSASPVQCQTSNLPCTNPTLLTCGPSNTVTPSSFSYPTPYGNFYTKMRAQYIYTAAELIAAGINAGNLSSIAFNITNMNTSITSYPNFNISVGCSGQSTFSALSDQTSLITGLTNVYSNASANVAVGINTYPFTQPYSWDGSSNLIVDVCFEVPGTYSYTSNAQVSCSNTSNYSSLSVYSDTEPTCNLNTSTSAFYSSYPAQMRPVATFGWCNAVANASMYNYSINPNTGIVGNITGDTTTISPPATTHYVLTTTTNYGGLTCFKTDSFTLNVIQPFSIVPKPDTLFCTSTLSYPVKAVFLNNSTHQPVTEPATWTIINNLPGLTGNDGFGTSNFSPHNAGVGTYSLVITAGGQCTVTDTVVFKVDTFNTAKFFVPDSLFCLTDGNVQLRPTTPGGTWSGLGVNNNGVFSPYTAGGATNPSTSIIKYVVNGGTPCADSATATMTIYKNPTVTFITDTTEGCVPKNIGFSSAITPSVTTGSYVWYFSDGQTAVAQNTSHIYTTAGLYSPKVVYTDVNGCRDSSTHVNSITIHALPVANFYANPVTTDILSPHVDFINTTVPSNCTWAWDIAGLDTSSNKNTSHNFDEPNIYHIELTATNQYNCKDVYSKDLNITGAYALYVPSGFTPNGDGKNDVFKPDGFGLSDNNIGYKMEVYDRWGQKIFESGDINVGWDGSKNGIAIGQDVFVYNIIFKDYENRTHTQKGQVLLIR